MDKLLAPRKVAPARCVIRRWKNAGDPTFRACDLSRRPADQKSPLFTRLCLLVASNLGWLGGSDAQAMNVMAINESVGMRDIADILAKAGCNALSNA